MYSGDIKNGQPDSKNGILFDKDGTQEYQGLLVQGVRMGGKGKLFHSNRV